MSHIRFDRWNCAIALLLMQSMLGATFAVAQDIENYQVMQLKCNQMNERERGRCFAQAKAKDEALTLRCEGLTSAKQMCLADIKASNQADSAALESETRQRQIDQELNYLDCGPFGC